VVVSMLALLPGARGSHTCQRAQRCASAAIREGLVYLRNRPVVLGAMTLDMFAVLFGGAKALLPIYAVDILHATPPLRSAELPRWMREHCCSGALVALPTPSRLGMGLAGVGAAFGLATIAFGLSRWLPLRSLTYAAVGAADQVSVVMRLNTIHCPFQTSFADA